MLGLPVLTVIIIMVPAQLLKLTNSYAALGPGCARWKLGHNLVGYNLPFFFSTKFLAMDMDNQVIVFTLNG